MHMLLEEMLEEVDSLDGGIFRSEDGALLSYEAMRWQIQRACEDAHVPYKGQHVFRHTFTTNCYYKGVNVKMLSNLLGHADVNVTYSIYVHLYGDGFDEIYPALVAEPVREGLELRLARQILGFAERSLRHWQ